MSLQTTVEVDTNENKVERASGAARSILVPFCRLVVVFVALTWSIVSVYRTSTGVYAVQRSRFLFPKLSEAVEQSKDDGVNRRLLVLLGAEKETIRLVKPDLTYEDRVMYDE